MDGRPPLELAVEVTDAAGNRTRWDGNAKSAGDIPTGITFNTKRGDGFSDGPSITLQRRIDRDYHDINLYDDVRLIGADGSTAYEGSVAASPRTFDGGHSVGVRVAGNMTLAQRRPFSEVFIDRDLSKFTSPSNARQGIILAAAFTPYDPSVQADPATGNSSVVTQATTGDWTALNRPLSEALYLAPSGVKLGKLYYKFGPAITINPADGTWQAEAQLGDDDKFTADDTTGNLFPSTSGTGTLAATTNTRTAAFVRIFAVGSSGGALGANTIPFGLNWRNLAAIGTHGLTLQESTTAGPGGLYASDIIRNICDRFTDLDSSGVQDTTYPIDHVVFEQVQPYDAWLQCNTYHLWELAVWENKTLHYYPADLSTADWYVRSDDPGVTLDVPGDSVENLANGVVVTYLDVQTGRNEVLDPDVVADLKDPNPLNPATLRGIEQYTPLDLTSVPLTAADATQLGIAWLAEYLRAKAAGTIKIVGHIRDFAGHWQQGWKVRASQTIAIVNHPDDRPRLIGETSWDQDSLTCTIAVDNTLNRVDAWLDRTATALKAANVAGGV